MIDFKNGSFVKLKPTALDDFTALLTPLLVPDEQLMYAFRGMRDGIVLTNRRVFAINVQGLSGKKKDFTSLPYSKIQAFSMETAGMADLDSELELWFSGLGKVTFEFSGTVDLNRICRMIAEQVL